MASVGSAELLIQPSFKGGYKSISKQFGGVADKAGQDTGKSFGSGMQSSIGGMAGKIFAPLAAAAGGIALGSFFKGAVEEASGLNEAGTALTAVFGEDAVGAVNEFASGGAKALGQTNLEVLNAAKTFGIYGKAAGLAGDENAKFSTDLVALSTDLASFHNAEPQEVVDALGSALRGEAEPMRRFGVLLDDATLKSKAMELGLYDGNGALSQQAKIMAANAAIIDQTGDAQGDFAKTSGGLANQQRILSATWTNFAGTLGTTLLPYVTSFVTMLNDKAGPALEYVSGLFESGAGFLDGWLDGFGNVSSAGDFMTTLQATIQTAIETLIAWLPGAVGEFVPTMVEGIVSRYSLLLDAFAAIVPALVSLIPALLPTLVEGAVQLFTGLVRALMVIVPMLVSTASSLIPTIVTALTTAIPVLLTGALALFRALVNAIPLILPPLLTAVIGLLPILVETLLGMVPSLIETALSLFDTLVQAFILVVPILIETLLGMLPMVVEALIGMLPTLIDSALSLFLGIVTGLLSALPTLLSSIVGMLPSIITSLLSMLPAIIDGAVQLFNGLIEAIPVILPLLLASLGDIGPELVSTIIGLIPTLFQAGKDLIGGLLDGIKALAGTVGQFFLDLLPGWIVGPFKAALGIHSPSTVFAGFGENIGEGLVRGIDAMGRPVQSAMRSLAEPPALASSLAVGATISSGIEAGSALAPAVAAAAGDIVVQIDGREVARAVRNNDRRFG